MRWFSLFLCTFWSAASTAEVATIHLTDGSTIVGEVRSLKNGTYLIEGESLGRMEIPQEQIRVVQYGAAATVAPQDQLSAQPTYDIDSLRAAMLANPAILSIIQSLQSDPQFQAVAADPEIQNAINTGDYLSLMTNPKIQQLMRHSAVKAISGEIEQ